MARTLQSLSKNLSLPVLLLIGVGVLFVFVAVVGLVVQNGEFFFINTGEPSPARVGQKLADFTVEDLEGKMVQLSDFSGRPVLINFWATWCPPCKREMPGLNDFYVKNQSKGFVILAVNTGESRDMAAAFASEMALQFPVAIDPEYALSDRLMIENYPTSIFIGRDGKVKLVHIGYFSPDDLERELSGLLE